ncbi:hypothetical protein WKV44_07330 [Spirochaetia bacterium 38H-sp]|uniref:Uncharacterized protein n=1 Tax=Rarispira pelagica TaxID=3141764 RepID=A0ABU9UCF8_9SPIR
MSCRKIVFLAVVFTVLLASCATSPVPVEKLFLPASELYVRINLALEETYSLAEDVLAANGADKNVIDILKKSRNLYLTNNGGSWFFIFEGDYSSSTFWFDAALGFDGWEKTSYDYPMYPGALLYSNKDTREEILLLGSSVIGYSLSWDSVEEWEAYDDVFVHVNRDVEAVWSRKAMQNSVVSGRILSMYWWGSLEGGVWNQGMDWRLVDESSVKSAKTFIKLILPKLFSSVFDRDFIETWSSLSFSSEGEWLKVGLPSITYKEMLSAINLWLKEIL